MSVVALKALAIWFAILILAVLNGALREAVLTPTFGTAVGLISSGLILSTAILAVAWWFLPWLGVRQPAGLVATGLGWLALTLVFEFSFGFWQGKSWQTLFEAYSFRGGNIWPVVLLTIALAPCIAAKLRGWL